MVMEGTGRGTEPDLIMGRAGGHAFSSKYWTLHYDFGRNEVLLHMLT